MHNNRPVTLTLQAGDGQIYPSIQSIISLTHLRACRTLPSPARALPEASTFPPVSSFRVETNVADGVALRVDACAQISDFDVHVDVHCWGCVNSSYQRCLSR